MVNLKVWPVLSRQIRLVFQKLYILQLWNRIFDRYIDLSQLRLNYLQLLHGCFLQGGFWADCQTPPHNFYNLQ
jgi:hypothetical protein